MTVFTAGSDKGQKSKGAIKNGLQGFGLEQVT